MRLRLANLVPALIVSMLFAGLAQAIPHPGTPPYSDTWSYSNHHQAVDWSTDEGIFSGYDDGTFGGDLTINRAEFVKVMVLSVMTEAEVEACGEVLEIMDLEDYSDVDYSSWYAPYVNCARAQGWVTGDADANGAWVGTFRPSDPINAAEAMKVIREVNKETDNIELPGDGEAWYQPYVDYFSDFGIIYTTPSYDGLADYYKFTYSFDSVGEAWYEITRGEVAEFLFRLDVAFDEGAYTPYLSAEEYVDEYGATIQDNGDGTWSWYDLYFGFQLENLALGDWDLEDIRFYVFNPEGFRQGITTYIDVVYPAAINDGVLGSADDEPMFSVVVDDIEQGYWGDFDTNYYTYSYFCFDGDSSDDMAWISLHYQLCDSYVAPIEDFNFTAYPVDSGLTTIIKGDDSYYYYYESDDDYTYEETDYSEFYNVTEEVEEGVNLFEDYAYGFSFEYLNDWDLDASYYDGYPSIWITSPGFMDLEDSFGDIFTFSVLSFDVYPDYEGLTLDELTETFTEEIVGDESSSEVEEPMATTFGGQDGRALMVTDDSLGLAIMVVFTIGEDGVYMMAWIGDASTENVEVALEVILDSYMLPN